MAFPKGEKTNFKPIKNAAIIRLSIFFLMFLPWTWADKDSEMNLIFLDLSALDLPCGETHEENTVCIIININVEVGSSD